MINHKTQKTFKRHLLSLINGLRGRSRIQLLILLISFLFPSVIYLYITGFHRLVNLRELFNAFHTMTLPVVKGHPLCRHINSTHYKCLPNTFLIGASKCGTTSLIEYLSDINGIEIVNRRISVRDHHREIHRFDRNTYNYALDYIELADEWASSPIVTNPNTVIIHYTPHYLYSPMAPYHMRNFYPSDDDSKNLKKFIVMLRDPVERSLSAYWFANSHLFGKKENKGSITEFMNLFYNEHNIRKDYESCMQKQMSSNSISNSITIGNSNSNSNSNSIINLENDIKNIDNRDYYNALQSCFGNDLGGKYLDKSIYADQIHRWFLNFPPPKIENNSNISDSDNNHENQYYFATLEDMKKNTSDVLKNLLLFLEVKVDDHNQNHNQNQNQNHRNFSDYNFLSKPNKLKHNLSNIPSNEFINSMYEIYEPYTKKLQKILYDRLKLKFTHNRDSGFHISDSKRL
jgi:hypothetical protein